MQGPGMLLTMLNVWQELLAVTFHQTPEMPTEPGCLQVLTSVKGMDTLACSSSLRWAVSISGQSTCSGSTAGTAEEQGRKRR